MKHLHTIENIHKIFNTSGSNPLLVSCNDLNYWVCKYDRFHLNLFNELLAAEFAKIWNIKVPETSLIKVKEEHIPNDMIPRLQKYWFDKECFGSLYLENAKEIDQTMFSLFKEKMFRDKVRNKSDFLKIALFDIWLSNEDRNFNNFNLLLNTSSDKISFFYAIDHVNLFNTSSLQYGLCELTEDESIIKTELSRILFSRNTNTRQIVNTLIQNFYLCTLECKDNLPEILRKIPPSWNLDLKHLKYELDNSIFRDSWLKKCDNTFKQFVQSFILN